MPIIDSQVHAYEANTPQRPWHNLDPKPLAHVTGEELVAAMDRVGVDGAILVSGLTIYHYDASYAVEVQRAYPGRIAIVKPVDTEDPAAAEVLAEWKRTPGAVGIRSHLLDSASARHPAGGNAMRAPDDSGLERVLRAAGREDLAVNLHCWGNLDNAMTVIDRHPGTRFVIDHVGIVQPRTAPAPADAWADLPRLLELARRPNAALKLSGVCTLSRQGYPYDDLWEPLERIFEAWGLERCLWGSDWTRTFSTVTYKQALEPFRLTQRLNEGERAMLMGGACARAYGWSPQQRTAAKEFAK